MKSNVLYMGRDGIVGGVISVVSFLTFIFQWALPFRVNIILVCALLFAVSLRETISFFTFLVLWLGFVSYSAIFSFELIVIGLMTILFFFLNRIYISSEKESVFFFVFVALYTIIFWILFYGWSFFFTLFVIDLVSSLASSMILYGGVLWLKRIFF